MGFADKPDPQCIRERQNCQSEGFTAQRWVIWTTWHTFRVQALKQIANNASLVIYICSQLFDFQRSIFASIPFALPIIRRNFAKKKRQMCIQSLKTSSGGTAVRLWSARILDRFKSDCDWFGIELNECYKLKTISFLGKEAELIDNGEVEIELMQKYRYYIRLWRQLLSNYWRVWFFLRINTVE